MPVQLSPLDVGSQVPSRGAHPCLEQIPNRILCVGSLLLGAVREAMELALENERAIPRPVREVQCALHETHALLEPAPDDLGLAVVPEVVRVLGVRSDRPLVQILGREAAPAPSRIPFAKNLDLRATSLV